MTQANPIMQKQATNTTSPTSVECHTKAAECCNKAAAEHTEAAKACASGDYEKAAEHVKKAECHCADAQEHSKKAKAA